MNSSNYEPGWAISTLSLTPFQPNRVAIGSLKEQQSNTVRNV